MCVANQNIMLHILDSSVVICMDKRQFLISLVPCMVVTLYLQAVRIRTHILLLLKVGKYFVFNK